jgi:hypothetical protein
MQEKKDGLSSKEPKGGDRITDKKFGTRVADFNDGKTLSY